MEEKNSSRQTVYLSVALQARVMSFSTGIDNFLVDGATSASAAVLLLGGGGVPTGVWDRHNGRGEEDGEKVEYPWNQRVRTEHALYSRSIKYA